MKKIYCDICGEEIPKEELVGPVTVVKWHKLILKPIPDIKPISTLDSSVKSIDVCAGCAKIIGYFMKGTNPEAFNYLVKQYRDKVL